MHQLLIHSLHHWRGGRREMKCGVFLRFCGHALDCTDSILKDVLEWVGALSAGIAQRWGGWSFGRNDATLCGGGDEGSTWGLHVLLGLFVLL